MSKEDLKHISNISVSKNCYKTLKMESIDREISLQDVVKSILEKATSRKAKRESILEEWI